MSVPISARIAHAAMALMPGISASAGLALTAILVETRQR